MATMGQKKNLLPSTALPRMESMALCQPFLLVDACLMVAQAVTQCEKFLCIGKQLFLILLVLVTRIYPRDVIQRADLTPCCIVDQDEQGLKESNKTKAYVSACVPCHAMPFVMYAHVEGVTLGLRKASWLGGPLPWPLVQAGVSHRSSPHGKEGYMRRRQVIL